MEHHYVLSRFLISRMLTVTRIPNSKVSFIQANVVHLRGSERKGRWDKEPCWARVFGGRPYRHQEGAAFALPKAPLY